LLLASAERFINGTVKSAVKKLTTIAPRRILLGMAYLLSQCVR